MAQKRPWWERWELCCGLKADGTQCRAYRRRPCDMLIKRDPSAGNMISGAWKNQMHLRRAHCYWIVLRNSNKCEREVI